ncbi:MAG TPA: hypothetical protein VKQ27_19035, partial [Acetobacteraceae bacterium]|nr:hypothetical protein [Acetobacteraceae bacterium]
MILRPTRDAHLSIAVWIETPGGPDPFELAIDRDGHPPPQCRQEERVAGLAAITLAPRLVRDRDSAPTPLVCGQFDIPAALGLDPAAWPRIDQQ